MCRRRRRGFELGPHGGRSAARSTEQRTSSDSILALFFEDQEHVPWRSAGDERHKHHLHAPGALFDSRSKSTERRGQRGLVARNSDALHGSMRLHGDLTVVEECSELDALRARVKEARVDPSATLRQSWLETNM